MRTSQLLLALPVLAAADQAPLLDQLKGYWSQAQASISSVVSGVSTAIPSAPSSIPIPANPAAAAAASAAAGVAALNVERITLDNHKDVLKAGRATASPGLEEWLIFVTGGNKTCFGLCNHAETQWNESVALLSASPSAPTLGMLDCEGSPVLCNAWAIGPPSLIHLVLPQPLADQSLPATTYRTMDLNRTSVTAQQIANFHIKEEYKNVEPYEGLWHPYDGPLAKLGLNIPIGYAIWGFSVVPSWLFMIVVSFVSRNVM